MKKIPPVCSTILFAFVFNSSLNAQSFEWANAIGGQSGEFPRSIALDATGYIYTIGFFLGTSDFDSGAGTFDLISAGMTDVFITKYNPSGNFVWAKSFGGTGAETGYGLTLDDDGNIYTTGSFQDTVDFNPDADTFNLISAGKDVFVCKLNGSGDFIWAKNFAGTSDSEAEGSSIASDELGNIYATGYFKDSVDFDPDAGTEILSGGMPGDVFVVKLNSSGNIIWAGEIGGSAADKGTSIQVDASGNVCVSGIFQQQGDFDPGNGTFNLVSNGQFDMFVCKFDDSGNFMWAKSFGGDGSDYSNAMSIDPSGNIYTSGQYFSTVDFDPGSGIDTITSAGTWDIFISKLDETGSFIWAKSMGGTDGDEAFGIFADASGNIFSAGKYRATADFDPSANNHDLTSSGNYDIYIGKYDTSGNLIWVESMGDTSVDYAYSIVADSDGNIYSTGTFDGTIDCDFSSDTFNLSSSGQGDIFLLKLSEMATHVDAFEFINATEVVVYPNPSDGILSIETNSVSSIEEIKILNSMGQIVFRNCAVTLKTTIDVSTLPSGLYFVLIELRESSSVTKLIIE